MPQKPLKRLLPISLYGFALTLGLSSASVYAENKVNAADLVLKNGHILTVDANSSSANAVAIKDGKFLVVGSNDDVAAHTDTNTKVIDLNGKTVIPGLIDNHQHQYSGALNAKLVSLLNAKSIADVQKALEERAQETPKGEWIGASSAWHESTLNERRLPTRTEIDAVTPDNPVYIPRGGHVMVANSAALKIAEIDANTPDPEGGVIVRDSNGVPTGVLLESATKLLKKHLPAPAQAEEHPQLLKDFMQQLNSYGITGVVDPGLDNEQIAVYRQLHDNNELSVRTHMLHWIHSLDEANQFVNNYTPFSNDMLALDGVKYLLDGGVEGAYLTEPYQIVEGEQTNPDYRGVLLLPKGGQEEFEAALQIVAKHGWQAQTHVVGDATIDVALDTYEKIKQNYPIGDMRWALMHVFLPSEKAIKRMKALDLEASIQNHPLLLGNNQVRYWGDERAAYAIPTRALLDAGVKTSAGTDAPVLPANPYLALSWLITRELMNGDILGPEQAITREEALRLYTINSARLMGADHKIGSIEPGKLADLVVLSDNYLEIPEKDIKSLQADLTLLGGQVVWDRAAK